MGTALSTGTNLLQASHRNEHADSIRQLAPQFMLLQCNSLTSEVLKLNLDRKFHNLKLNPAPNSL